jgi:hypothetical protein
MKRSSTAFVASITNQKQQSSKFSPPAFAEASYDALELVLDL